MPVPALQQSLAGQLLAAARKALPHSTTSCCSYEFVLLDAGAIVALLMFSMTNALPLDITPARGELIASIPPLVPPNQDCNTPAVHVVVHGPPDHSNDYWNMRRLGARMAMGTRVTFVAVGLDFDRHASAISAACEVAEALVTSVPFEPGSAGYVAIDDAINERLFERPTLPILSTDNDNYHNSRLVAFVGPQSYDVGVQCGRALLFTTPQSMGDADGLDIILGRVPPLFYHQYPGGVVPVYVAPGQEGNNALVRRFSAINRTLAAHGATARLTTEVERGARRTVLLTGGQAVHLRRRGYGGRRAAGRVLSLCNGHERGVDRFRSCNGA